MKFSFEEIGHVFRNIPGVYGVRRIIRRMGSVKTAVFFLLVLTGVTFSASINNDFVNWDDNLYVTDNRLVQEMSWGNIKKIFTASYVYNYQPLVLLSYALEYRFFGLSPIPYHLTNVVLHLVNTGLVFYLFYLIARNTPVAFVTALLFGIHPLHVESVAWISQRKDVLYAAFFLGALICYCYHCRERRLGRFYFFAFFLFVGALLSKSMAITLPVVFCLMDYCFSRFKARIGWLEKIPFFLLAVFFAILGGRAQLGGAPLTLSFSRSVVWEKITQASYSVFFYLAKIFYPVNLSSLYPYTRQQNFDNVLFYFSTSFIVLGGLFILARDKRQAVFGGVFFLVVLAPALQFVPLGEILVADRYTYVSSLGLFYVVACLLWSLWQGVKSLRGKIVLMTLGLGLTGVLMVVSWNRCLVWKNSITLWSDVLKKYPDDPTALVNRGIAFMETGHYRRAQVDFEKLEGHDSDYVRRDPSYGKFYYYYNLSNSYNVDGRYEQAKRVLKEGFTNNPDFYPHYYLNLAISLWGLGEQEKAIEIFDSLIQQKLLVADACYQLGVLYARRGQIEKAMGLWQKALAADPAYVNVYYVLGYGAHALGDRVNATKFYKKYLALAPGDSDILNDLSAVYNEVGRYREAVRCAKQVLAKDPQYVGAYINLGTAYYALGKTQLALEAFQKAMILEPRLGVVYNNLARIHFDLKKYKEAIHFCDKAIEFGYPVDPGFLDQLELYRKKEALESG